MNTFDEQEAIDFIRSNISQNLADRCDDDTILEIIDLIFDYYEDNGMLEIDCDEEDDADISDMLQYILKIIKKDKHLNHLSADDITEVIKAETAYELSLED